MKRIAIFIATILVGVSSVYLFQYYKNSFSHPVEKKIMPESFSIENPPSESLKATIISMSGKINWQGRTATQSVELKSPRPIQQGEELQTDKNGNLTLEFSNALTIYFSPKTSLYFAQTLPSSLVLNQTGGNVEYVRRGTSPVGVRAMSLLVDIPSGQTTVWMDNGQQLVSVTPESNNVTVAFNDSNFVSTVVTVPKGKVLLYDNSAKDYTMK